MLFRLINLFISKYKNEIHKVNDNPQGEQVFQSLLEAGRDRQIVLKIAQNMPSRASPNTDSQILAKKANAQVNFFSLRHFDKVKCRFALLAQFYSEFFSSKLQLYLIINFIFKNKRNNFICKNTMFDFIFHNFCTIIRK